MAGYAFRSLEDRRKVETLWEKGRVPKEIASELGTSVSVIYNELSRGRDGSRLPDQRLRYNAELAQIRVQKSLERRGKRNNKNQGAEAREDK